MQKMEIRTTRRLEIRASDEASKLSGYAAVFNSLSENLGGFREQIAPGAFKRTLGEVEDVYALADHDESKRLGRLSNKSLRLSEDDIGLAVDIDAPDTQLGRDTVEEVRSGLLDGMSFGFFVREDNWDEAEDMPIRTLLDVDLIEVSLVSFPAYRDTSVEAAKRSMDAWRKTRPKPNGARRRRLLEAELSLREL